MEKLDWSKLEGKYWKPIENGAYTVTFSNWRIENTDFNGKTKAKNVLTLDVNRVEDGEQNTSYEPPKEFSTSSNSFITQIRPLIDTAIANNLVDITVIVRRFAGNRWEIIDIDGILKSRRRVVSR